MKGISTTLVIIVTAIVVLIAALVVLTIFGEAIWPIADITNARNMCIQQAGATCVSVGTLPPTWTAQFNYKDGGTVVPGSCAAFFPSCKCEKNKLVDCTLSG